MVLIHVEDAPIIIVSCLKIVWPFLGGADRVDEPIPDRMDEGVITRYPVTELPSIST